MTLSTAALASQLAISDGHAAVPAALQLATLTAARALAGHVGASLAATSVISIPVSALVEGALQAMFANQVKTIALPLLLVAGTVATGVTVGAAQLGGGAGGRNRDAPCPTISPAKAKAQRQPPGPQSDRAAEDGVAELIMAATLFDRAVVCTPRSQRRGHQPAGPVVGFNTSSSTAFEQCPRRSPGCGRGAPGSSEKASLERSANLPRSDMNKGLLKLDVDQAKRS